MSRIVDRGHALALVVRALLALLLTLSSVGCGGSITNPLHEGFEVDPTPILGTWHMVGEEGTTDSRYSFVIERGSDYLFGEVRFRMFSQDWQMFFTDVHNWDGNGFHFYHSETHGLGIDRLRWNVGYRPPVERTCPPGWTGGHTYPAQLVLSGPRSMTFRRPGTEAPEGSLICRRAD